MKFDKYLSAFKQILLHLFHIEVSTIEKMQNLTKE